MAVGGPYQDKINISVGNQQNVTRAIVETHGLALIKQFVDLMTGHIRRLFQQIFLKCIKLRGNVKLVVDPFVGVGSSAVASVDFNRSFIRFEIDNFYLDITAKSLKTLS